MARQRYRVMLSSTVETHLVSVQQIFATSLAQAEGRATSLLRARRIAGIEGKAWDRWDLGDKLGHLGAWRHVANGDRDGTQWSVRGPQITAWPNGTE